MGPPKSKAIAGKRARKIWLVIVILKLVIFGYTILRKYRIYGSL